MKHSAVIDEDADKNDKQKNWKMYTAINHRVTSNVQQPRGYQNN